MVSLPLGGILHRASFGVVAEDRLLRDWQGIDLGNVLLHSPAACSLELNFREKAGVTLAYGHALSSFRENFSRGEGTGRYGIDAWGRFGKARAHLRAGAVSTNNELGTWTTGIGLDHAVGSFAYALKADPRLGALAHSFSLQVNVGTLLGGRGRQTPPLGGPKPAALGLHRLDVRLDERTGEIVFLPATGCDDTAYWRIEVKDGNGRVVRSFDDVGAPPPEIRWRPDGVLTDGLVASLTIIDRSERFGIASAAIPRTAPFPSPEPPLAMAVDRPATLSPGGGAMVLYPDNVPDDVSWKLQLSTADGRPIVVLGDTGGVPPVGSKRLELVPAAAER
jgi:hypothetical protein